MTNKIKVAAIGLIVMLSACAEKGIDNNKSEVRDGAAKLSVQSPVTCCEVTCKNGKCSTASSPCNCECTWWGNPVCTGGSKVYASEFQLARFDMIVNFIYEEFGTIGNTMANAIENIKNLFQKNDGFYTYTIINDDGEEITTEIPVPEDEKYFIPESSIEKYHEYLKIIDAFCDKQPASIKQKIADF